MKPKLIPADYLRDNPFAEKHMYKIYHDGDHPVATRIVRSKGKRPPKGGKVKKIEWSIMVIPPKIVAVCATCRYELARVLYNGYKEREEKLKTLQLELSSCPKCKAVFKIQQ